MISIIDVDWFVYQKHFRWTISGPDSWYSALLIHMFWKVEREARRVPPIHTKYLLSAGTSILIFIWLPAMLEISLDSLLFKLGNMVEPPDSTML